MVAYELDETNEHYAAHGWCVIDLPDLDSVLRIREALEAKLRELCGDERATLPRYHEFVSDADHEETHWQLSNFFWECDFSFEIGRAQLGLFRDFIGPDIHLHPRPYLRIPRPGRPEDNIGLHRDTFYGQSAYEITVHIPFTDTDEGNALRVVSGSHVRAETDYTIISLGKAAWGRGSPKHQMGFPHTPKKIVDDLSGQLKPITLQVGQAMMFSPALVHGLEVNTGSKTRISIDLRIVSSLAPIMGREEAESHGYRVLSASAATSAARSYYEKNSRE